METSLFSSEPSLSSAQEKNIEILCRVATRNGSCLTLREVLELTSLDLGEQDLAVAWNISKSLSSKFKVFSGQIIDINRPVTQDDMGKRSVQAESNLCFARKFARFFRSIDSVYLLSVSGSTSYRSVSQDDDLDFFCITKKDSLWIFMFVALVISRIFRATQKVAPTFCFSCTMEENYARKIFNTRNDGLFARDALTVIVLKGEQFYGNLLKENSWIRKYFSRIYNERISETERNRSSVVLIDTYVSSTLRKITNIFLSVTLGNYIRIKSELTSRRYSKAGANARIFKAKIDAQRCIFESNDYIELHKEYLDFQAV